MICSECKVVWSLHILEIWEFSGKKFYIILDWIWVSSRLLSRFKIKNYFIHFKYCRDKYFRIFIEILCPRMTYIFDILMGVCSRKLSINLKLGLCQWFGNVPFHQQREFIFWHDGQRFLLKKYYTVKWGVCSRWSSSLYRPMRKSDEMTIGKMHSTLLLTSTFIVGCFQRGSFSRQFG